MKASLVFAARRELHTVTDLVVDGLEVHGLANHWNTAEDWIQKRSLRITHGTSQLHYSATLVDRVLVRETVKVCLEGLLIEGDQWIAGGHGGLFVSVDRGKTWQPSSLVPGAHPIHSVVRFHNVLWVAGPFGLLARQRSDGSWQAFELPAAASPKLVVYRASVGYPSLGISRLVIAGDALYLLGHGLWRLSNEDASPVVQEVVSKRLLVDLARTRAGTLIAVGVEGTCYRREQGKAWEPAKIAGRTRPGYVAVVADDTGVLVVAKRGKPAVSWSTDDGVSFSPIKMPTLDRKACLHLAVADGHGGMLVSGFNGLLLRVSRDGGLGPWANRKGGARTKVERAPVVARPAARKPQVADNVGARLLTAVLAAPDDDAPRLVYADWLIEQGDPRGEFIQIQCLLRRTLTGVNGRPSWFLDDEAKRHPDHLALAEREQAIYKAHGGTWIAPIRSYLRQLRWERGFITDVTSGPPFLVGASLVLSSHPLARLVLEGMKTADLAQLAGTAFPYLRRLSLSSQNISAKTSRCLLGENLATLESLDLTANDLGDAGTILLAEQSQLRQLTWLALGGCSISDAGARSLASSAVLARLETLVLWGNPIGKAGFEALLASTHLTRVKTLHVGGATKVDARMVARLGERYTVIVR